MQRYCDEAGENRQPAARSGPFNTAQCWVSVRNSCDVVSTKYGSVPGNDKSKLGVTLYLIDVTQLFVNGESDNVENGVFPNFHKLSGS